MTSQTLSKIVTQIQQLADVEAVWLYGSQSKGTAASHSDIDLAIAFNHIPNDPLERVSRPSLVSMQLAESLGMSELLISVVDINLIPTYLAFNVVSEGEVIYSIGSDPPYREFERITSLFEYEMIEAKRYA